jgi:hypothetical protein
MGDPCRTRQRLPARLQNDLQLSRDINGPDTLISAVNVYVGIGIRIEICRSAVSRAEDNRGCSSSMDLNGDVSIGVLVAHVRQDVAETDAEIGKTGVRLSLYNSKTPFQSPE